MITLENKAILKKRLMSLAWRVGTMVSAVVVAFISNNIGLIELPVWVIGLVGLILAEITKWLNTQK